MHPELFELALPRFPLPLGITLGTLAVFGALLAVVGLRRRALDLVVVAGVGAVAASVGALVLRGSVLVLAPIPVPAFGALLALSLSLGAVLTLRFASRAGLSREQTSAACVAAAVAGVLGARVGYALLYARELGGVARLFAFQDGGLLAYGGLFFGIAAAWLALDKSAERLLGFLDAAAPGFGFGVFLTRIGCWLEGCDFGRLLGAGGPDLLRTLGTFPAGSRAWAEQVLAQKLSPAAPAALPVHPTELYEACGGALLVGLVLAIRSRQRARGHAALACLLGYALLRVLVDLFRDVSAEVWAARVLAALLAAGAVVLWPRLIPASRSA